MAGFDPTMVNQALAMQGSAYRVPTLEEARANAAQFPALPQAGQDVSMLEQAAAAQQLPMVGEGDVAPGFSMVPAPEPQVVQAAEPELVAPAPVQAQPQEQPQRQYTPQELAILLGRQRQGGGVANPVPQMLSDTTARRQTSESLTNAYEAQGDEASAGMQQAAADVGEARQATYGDVAKVYDAQAKETTAYQQQVADVEDTTNKAMSSVQQEERDISDWMEKNRAPRDRRGVAQKVTGALAVAFSGLADQAILAASMNAGTPVQTDRMGAMVSLIQRGIDRDLESQRQMYDNARTQLAGKQTEYGQLREKKLDDRQALAVGRALGLERAANEIDAIKARGLSAEQVPLAEQAAEALRLERANLLQGVYNQRFEQAFNRENQLKMLRYQQSQPKRVSEKERLDNEGKALANEKARRELEGGGGANGAYGLQTLPGATPSEKGTQETQKLVSAAEGIRATIAQLRGMAAKGATLSPTERATARRRLQSIKSQFNGVFGDGTAPNEAQLQAMDEIFSNPTEVNMADVAKTLEVFDRDAVEMTNAKIRTYGYRLDDLNVRPE